MKFVVDAQLPRRLVRQLRQLGFEAQHTAPSVALSACRQ